MRMTYDPEADALEVWLATGARDVRTRQLASGVYVDFDHRGRLVGVEVLWASRHYAHQDLERLPTPVHYLTLPEAVKESRLKPATLRAAIRASELPALPRGRGWWIAQHHLWTYLENRVPRRRTPRRGASGRRPRQRAAHRER